ncbi:hypothetical protein PPACK8108_LOCUS2231, partial [Phakopsora pachyrhizi]
VDLISTLVFIVFIVLCYPLSWFLMMNLDPVLGSCSCSCFCSGFICWLVGVGD